eukprot:3221909-Amphidinium_carterae.1
MTLARAAFVFLASAFTGGNFAAHEPRGCRRTGSQTSSGCSNLRGNAQGQFAGQWSSNLGQFTGALFLGGYFGLKQLARSRSSSR